MQAVNSLDASMTMRFQGVTFEQLARIHQAVENAKTKVKAPGCHPGEPGGVPGRPDVSVPGEPETYMIVSKSELQGAGGTYTVIITVNTVLEGWIHPLLRNQDRRWAKVRPSRSGLDGIFDALGILPAEETIEDLPSPGSR